MDEALSAVIIKCQIMPESFSAFSLEPSVTWWRDPARRLRFIVVSLFFAFTAFFSVTTSASIYPGWQTAILGLGVIVCYVGLLVQQWHVERGVALVAAGLVIVALSASFGLLLGYPLVCLQVYIISAYLHQRKKAWLVFALVGSFVAVGAQFIVDRFANPIYGEPPSPREVYASPEFWVIAGVTGLLIGVSIALSWQFGKQTQQRREAVANLAARAELATVSERNRIAREMHDIVAHSLTIVIAQADGGRYAGRQDPAKAIDALETISARGREALTQMRGLLSVLHEGDDRSTTSIPGVSGLGDLISDANRSGTHATLKTEGTERTVDEVRGLTIYRVVQESLTNVLKHAGAVEVRVKLLWEPNSVIVTVDNAPGEDAMDGSGRGLTGIAERVRIHGGKATWGASPLFPGGWNVTATIPLAG